MQCCVVGIAYDVWCLLSQSYGIQWKHFFEVMQTPMPCSIIDTSWKVNSSLYYMSMYLVDWLLLLPVTVRSDADASPFSSCFSPRLNLTAALIVAGTAWGPLERWTLDPWPILTNYYEEVLYCHLIILSEEFEALHKGI